MDCSAIFHLVWSLCTEPIPAKKNGLLEAFLFVVAAVEYMVSRIGPIASFLLLVNQVEPIRDTIKPTAAATGIEWITEDGSVDLHVNRWTMSLNCVKFSKIYILLDGNLSRGAHVRRNLFYSTCLRHLIRSRAVTNRIFLSGKTMRKTLLK